jgi:hypothetical protein
VARQRTPRTNQGAAEATIRALRQAGRLEAVDDALVAGFRTIAAAVDADPGNASLWREYRAFEARLRETGDHVDDDLADVLRAMSAPVGDPPT